MMYPNNSPGKQMSMFVAVLLLFVTGWTQAAQITVSADRNLLRLDETFQLIFSLDEEPQAEPDFSALKKDFDVLGTTQSRNISIVNGNTTRTLQYRVTVLPRHGGQLTIPPISFGSEQSPELRLQVTDSAATSDPGGKATKETVFLEVAVDQTKPYVQQQVILTVRIYSRIQWREASLSEPEFAGGEVLLKKLGQDRSYQKQREGKNWRVIERRYALFPQKSGELNMQLLTLNLRIPGERQQRRTPFSGFNDPFMDDFFSRRSYRNKIVRSSGLQLDVQPIPSTFDGKRWLIAKDIRLEENWSESPDKLKAGEPVTRTLEIIADGVTVGQLPPLQLPAIDGLRVYPDDPANHERVTDKGILSTNSSKFAIIPTRAGKFELPAVELTWWNSNSGREQTARIPPRELVVTGLASVGKLQQSTNNAAKPQQILLLKQEQNSADRTDLVATKGQHTTLNSWLLAAVVLLLVLWLLTLFLLLRKKPAPRTVNRVEKAAGKVTLAASKKQLQQAVATENAAAVAEALLEVAKNLWQEFPPSSLEAMAEKLDSSTAQELRALSRHLYADENTKWDAGEIEQAVNQLQPQTSSSSADSALKPLYPAA